MKVEAIKHLDVQGNEKYYVKVSSKTKTHLMVSGKSTFNKLKEMEAEDKQPELPLNTENNATEMDNQDNKSGRGNRGNNK